MDDGLVIFLNSGEVRLRISHLVMVRVVTEQKPSMGASHGRKGIHDGLDGMRKRKHNVVPENTGIGRHVQLFDGEVCHMMEKMRVCGGTNDGRWIQP